MSAPSTTSKAQLVPEHPIGFDARRRPPDETTAECIKRCCYDPDRGTFWGRTPASWAKILAFYVVFYGFLAAFFFSKDPS